MARRSGLMNQLLAWGLVGGGLPLALLGACGSEGIEGGAVNGFLPAYSEQPGAADGNDGSSEAAGPDDAAEPGERVTEGAPVAGGLTGQSNGASTSGGSAPVTASVPPASPAMGQGGAGPMGSVVGAAGGAMAPVVSAGGAPMSTPPPGIAGAPGVPSPAPASPPGDCPGFFCDDFEGVAVGGSPDPARWSVIAGYARVTQAASVQVSAANRHSGAQALRVTQGGREGIIASVPQGRFFVRAWMQVDAAPLGPSLIGLGNDQNSEVRLRIRQNSWAGINVVPGDAVFPNGIESGNCPTCRVLPVSTWFCAEMLMDTAGRSATLWIDGQEAAAVTSANAWPAASAMPSLFLGTMSLQGGSTGVWIDDVVVSAERIGCD